MLREALRDVLSGDDAAVERINEAGERAGLRPVLRRGGGSALEPTAGGVDGALGRLVAIVHGAVADGTWAHLKACERTAAAGRSTTTPRTTPAAGAT